MNRPIHIGQSESVRQVFTQEDFDRFAALSGDDNPIHIDPAFSARTKFGRPVAHGMLLYSAVCSVLSARFPGPGTVQLEQELMFPSATYAGEEVMIELTVTNLYEASRMADLNTMVVRPNGDLGLRGRTLVRLPGEIEGLPRDELTLLGSTSARWSRAGREQGDRPAGPRFKGLGIGQRVEVRRTFSTEDLEAYADLTGDVNPIVAGSGAVAGKLGLAGPVIPGSLLGGMFSYLLGTRLPGRGTNYLKQQLQFPAYAHPGRELVSSVEITGLRPEKKLVNLRTICTESVGQVVCRGEALVLVSDVEPSAERG